MEETEMSLEARAFVSILIHEIDQYLRNPRLSDKERITEIEALLYTWVMANDLNTSNVETMSKDEEEKEKKIGEVLKR